MIDEFSCQRNHPQTIWSDDHHNDSTAVSQMRQHRHGEKWTKSVRESTISGHRLPGDWRLDASTRLQPGTPGRTPPGVAGTSQDARHQPHIRRVPEHAGGLDQKQVATLPSLRQTLPAAEADEVLAVDEAWSFVRNRVNPRWLWTVLLRRTRHLLAFVLGDHRERTCRRLWHRIPPAVRQCARYSDVWKAYAAGFPKATHRCVGKETGHTAHQERWDHPLRQRVARSVRNTLSFSKRARWHDRVTNWFSIMYNLSVSFNG
jgi:insertion element IS1 protein InsB